MLGADYVSRRSSWAGALPLRSRLALHPVLRREKPSNRTVDLDAAVVVNEAQFSKFVHEKTHSGPGRADHLRKRLLADLRDHRLRFLFLAKVRQQ